MNSPFLLDGLPNNLWAVSWPTFSASSRVDYMAFDILKFIFEEVKCDRAGLGLAIDEKEESTIMWATYDLHLKEITDEYSKYLYKNYTILGAVFEEEHQARVFKDAIEKRYAWQLLKE